MSSVLAHGDHEGNLWLAQVVDSGDKANPLVTIVRFRGKADAAWQEAARLDGRATGIAATAGQVGVLLEGGQWLTLGSSGLISGIPLPGRGPIRAIGSDGQTMWAVAVISGELRAQPRRFAPATTRSTQPATTRATQPVEMPVESAASAEPRVMLFRLDRDGWTSLGRLDARLDAAFAITGVRGRPIVAATGDAGTLQLFEETDHVGDITIGDARRFTLLSHDSARFLWTAGETGPGKIERRGGAPTTLTAKTDKPITGDRAIAIATGRLRLFYLGPNPQAPNGPRVIYEQKYDLNDFSPVGEPLAQAFPVTDLDPRLDSSIRALVMAAMIFAIIASFQHRRSVRELMERSDRPRPAPLGRRIGAAAVDAISLAACTAAGYFPFVGHSNPSLGLEVSLVSGPLGYVLYTMVTELIWQRTPGKILFGLKVIGLDRQEPTRGMILLRNALRIIDVFASPMLVLLLISPLRQRAGDIAAGTLVVLVNEPPRSKEQVLEAEDAEAEK